MNSAAASPAGPVATLSLGRLARLASPWKATVCHGGRAPGSPHSRRASGFSGFSGFERDIVIIGLHYKPGNGNL